MSLGQKNNAIEISDVMYGWLTLRIKNHVFIVSYLTDFKTEIEYLLCLGDNDTNVNRICLDGEGLYLYLTAWKNNCTDDLYILWEETHNNRRVEDIICLSYNETVEYFKTWFKKNKNLYKEQFAYSLFTNEKCDIANKFDFFRYDLKKIIDKYNLCLKINKGIDYDETPCLLGSYIEVESTEDDSYRERLWDD